MPKPPALTEEDRANLVAYLDGELRGPAAAALEAKISLHPAARAEAEGLRRTWELLDHLPRPGPSLQFTQMTLERISAQRPAARRRPWALGLAWAAAVLVAAAGGLAGGRLLPHRAGPPPAAAPPDLDAALQRDLGAIENRRLYEHVDDVKMLRALADPGDPDLFGDDNAES
jgi:anti-sigma factor RsiW